MTGHFVPQLVLGNKAPVTHWAYFEQLTLPLRALHEHIIFADHAICGPDCWRCLRRGEDGALLCQS